MFDAERARSIVGGVLEEALRTTGRKAVVVLADGSPEARLLTEWCQATVGKARTLLAAAEPEDQDVESLRYRARLIAREHNALTAHAANKTALLLGRDWPAEALLPLGDLYATQVAALARDWSLPPDAKRLVELAGGIEAVDRALETWFERWQPPEVALSALPAECRGPFLEAVRSGRFWRERAGLIPKLSARTIGIDLFA